MADDFYLQAGAQRLAMIEAERAAALADLQAHRANRDADSAAASVQQLANLDTELRNLNDLYVRYQQSQTPQQPPQVSKEQRAKREWHEMDWQDAWDMAAQSRHGVDENAFRAGIAEVARRRSRGE